MSDIHDNPMGLDGFEFIEFASPVPGLIEPLFEKLGFAEVARHRSKDVSLYRQGEINFIVNREPESAAAYFAREHGPSACGMAFRVRDSHLAYQRALALGAQPVEIPTGPMELRLPAIKGIGGAPLYLIDRYADGQSIYDIDFRWLDVADRHPVGHGLKLLDHLTHNVYRGRMSYWAGFYAKLFDFREIRYFDIQGEYTGLTSKAMTAPDGRIRIPLNEESKRGSGQIEEFLMQFNGEGIQHIALLTDDLVATIDSLQLAGVPLLTAPNEHYYQALESRLPGHGEAVHQLQARGILLDGTTGPDGKRLLLQIFSQAVMGPVFFEFIQRKGDDGFGEGNFKALFESIERDQIQRGGAGDDVTQDPRSAAAAPGYQSGFGNHFATEALPGALPVGRNSPQRVAYGLYAEQLSGTAFTAPRADNRRSWLYRIRPAAQHRPFEPFSAGRLQGVFGDGPVTPNQLRWNPLPLPSAPTDFIDGLITMAGHGDPRAQSGAAIHLYAANASMARRSFYSADGEWLVVPQLGRHRFVTELGVLEAEPQEIVVIPRGLRYRVETADGGPLRGYVCENFGAALRLPDLGPIGSNGLANPRDFLTPEAGYEDLDQPHELIAKFMGSLWRAEMDHSPIDVVAWHGNLAPYKYDLRRFNAIGSISFDHPDPSIFLVLHSASDTPGTSAIDFVVFPPRILAMQDTFRPPWFHRNVASEFMGLIHGAYDAKAEGFLPGGASLHNCMSGHGPDAGTFEKASAADLDRPDRIGDTMAFMFESRCVWQPTRAALETAELQANYFECWQGLGRRFDPARREPPAPGRDAAAGAPGHPQPSGPSSR